MFVGGAAVGEAFFVASESLLLISAEVATTGSGIPGASLTIAEIVAARGQSIPPDAMVNFGSCARGMVAPPSGSPSFWFRFSDIMNLPLTQIQGLIGAMTHGGSQGGASFMRVSQWPSSSFTPFGSSAGTEISEFICRESVPVMKSIEVTLRNGAP